MKSRAIMLILSLALFSMCCGCGSSSPTLDDRVATPAATVENGPLNQQIVLSGKTEAIQSSDVMSRISGRIKDVLVETASPVKKGQILVRLECNDLEASRDVCRANLENALITEKYAAVNYERAGVLLDSNVIAPSDFENQFEKPLEKARVDVRLAQANLKKAEIAYADAAVLAPFNGIVSSCAASPGEIALPQTPLLTVINIDKLVIRANADENQINRLQTGQVFPVDIPALNGQEFTAGISSIAPAPNPTSRAYEVELILDNPEHAVKAGMFARVLLPAEGSKQSQGG